MFLFLLFRQAIPNTNNTAYVNTSTGIVHSEPFTAPIYGLFKKHPGNPYVGNSLKLLTIYCNQTLFSKYKDTDNSEKIGPIIKAEITSDLNFPLSVPHIFRFCLLRDNQTRIFLYLSLEFLHFGNQIINLFINHLYGFIYNLFFRLSTFAKISLISKNVNDISCLYAVAIL